MRYLRDMTFPNQEREFDFYITIKRKVCNTFYPFQILTRNHLKKMTFAPITILYGGNGLGETTPLNVIAEKQ